MSSTSTPPTPSGVGAQDIDTDGLWRGVLLGFLPLGLLAGIVAAAVALTAGVRVLTIGLGFSAEQIATVLTLAVGLVIAFVVYTIGLVRIWRRMTAWWLARQSKQASGALWALAIAALIVLLPGILALVIPQHPAP